jgi:hypothetical protein
MSKDQREERSEQLERKYAALADREIRARKEAGKPLTTAHLHLIEMKHQSLAAHEMACEALKKADQFGEDARVCWRCGEVYHKEEGYFLNSEFCSAECYRAR